MRGKRGETNSVLHQGRAKLNEMFEKGKGTSKFADKKANAVLGNGYVPAADKVYMDRTLHDYDRYWADYYYTMQAVGYKVNNHFPRTLDEAKEFMPHYLEILKERPGNKPGTKVSAWTIRSYFAGIAKVLGLKAKDYYLPLRCRADIRRSRGDAKRDKHFSVEKNAALIEFCQCTGLRNASELQKIRGDCLVVNEKGDYCIRVTGKGKKERDARIIGTPEQIARVVARIKAAGDNLVWPKVPSHADIHKYRADYARAFYDQIARMPEEIPPQERYCCRKDQKGIWYDRIALMEVSRNLGHARANVIVEHYLDPH